MLESTPACRSGLLCDEHASCQRTPGPAGQRIVIPVMMVVIAAGFIALVPVVIVRTNVFMSRL